MHRLRRNTRKAIFKEMKAKKFSRPKMSLQIDNVFQYTYRKYNIHLPRHIMEMCSEIENGKTNKY